MRATLKLLALCVLVWLLAFAVHRTYLSDVVAIADADQYQAMWKVEAAFLLTALENIAVAGAVILLAVAATGWLRRWTRLWCQSSG